VCLVFFFKFIFRLVRDWCCDLRGCERRRREKKKVLSLSLSLVAFVLLDIWKKLVVLFLNLSFGFCALHGSEVVCCCKWSCCVVESTSFVFIGFCFCFFILSGNFESLVGKCIYMCVCVSLYVSAWLNFFFLLLACVWLSGKYLCLNPRL
jgi:hypothetical protein